MIPDTLYSHVRHQDLHDDSYNHLSIKSKSFQVGYLADGTTNGVKFDEECQYNISVYPSEVFMEQFSDESTLVITFAVAGIFVFAIFMFLVYDRLVERRQKLILDKAVQSTAIVSSLFP